MKGQWGKLVGWFVATLAVSTALTIGLPLIGGGSWLPDLISTEGKAIDDLFWGLLWMSLIIFALVGAIVIYCMIHFAAKPGDMGDGEHIHGNAKMELAWIIIPTIIVSIISVLSWIVLEDSEIGLFDESKANAKGAATMQVDVRGFSFGWAFRYTDKAGELLQPADAEPTNELVLPKGQVVRFNVMSCSGKEALGRVAEERTRELAAHDHETEFAEIEPSLCERNWDSTDAEGREKAEAEAEVLYEARKKHREGKKLTEEEQTLLDAQPAFKGDRQTGDVNHAFWVPEARLKIDAVAGLRTYVQWEASKLTGPDDNYQVVCAELCGSGHNGMRTDMCVVDQGTFDWWVGLETDERADASCLNLRLMNCFDDAPADRGEAIAAFAKLTNDKPDASCEDAKEAVA